MHASHQPTQGRWARRAWDCENQDATFENVLHKFHPAVHDVSCGFPALKKDCLFGFSATDLKKTNAFSMQSICKDKWCGGSDKCTVWFLVNKIHQGNRGKAIALSLLKVAKIFRISRDASPPLSWNSNITNFVVAIKLQSSKYSWLQWLHILSTKLGIRQAVPKIRTNNWAKLLS